MKFRSKSLSTFAHLVGLDINRTGHLEKWVSAMGGLFGILAVSLVSQYFLDGQAAGLVVASMGASAVLLFAVPHGPLSQPWAVFGGHTISAFIGVACARWIPDPALAAALSVSLAIGCMHYLRCIHPPGGATALTAVIGGPQLQALGFDYILTPVLINATSIVIIAILFNYGFSWRRYPAALASKAVPDSTEREPTEDSLTIEDLENALESMNSIFDISGEDLAEIYRLAQQHKHQQQIHPASLQTGQCYSNGQYGGDWQIRQIIDMHTDHKSPEHLLIYKILAGSERRRTATCTLEEFARWAKYEVFLNENSWQRASEQVNNPGDVQQAIPATSPAQA